MGSVASLSEVAVKIGSQAKSLFFNNFGQRNLFLQVDVGSSTLIGRLRIQRLSAYGETDRHYVSQFFLSYSLNGWEWNTELHGGVTKVKCNVNT